MRLKKIAITFFIFLLILVSAFFIFRNNILHYAFNNVKEKVKSRYNVSLDAEGIEFKGLQEVNVKNITLVPDSADTLISIQNISLNFSLTSLLTGSIGFNSIRCDTFSLYAYNEP